MNITNNKMVNLKIQSLTDYCMDYAIACALDKTPILGVNQFKQRDNVNYSFTLGVFVDGKLFSAESDDTVFNVVLPILGRKLGNVNFAFTRVEKSKWSAETVKNSELNIKDYTITYASTLKRVILQFFLKVSGFETFYMDIGIKTLCDIVEIEIPQNH